MNSMAMTSCCLVMALALTLQVISASVPDEDLLTGYGPDDFEAALDKMETPLFKRGMCRPGFTYQAILRSCLPSLGALRGRGRGGRVRN